VGWAACNIIAGAARQVLQFQHLALQAGHAGSHDLIHQQQVGGNNSAAVDHLTLHPDKRLVIIIIHLMMIFWPYL